MADASQDTRAGGAYEPGEAGAYWERLWQSGHRHRGIDAPEREALYRQVGVGRGRPALDIGSGDGALARHLAELGYRPTGIDCAPGALSAARHGHPSLARRLLAPGGIFWVGTSVRSPRHGEAKLWEIGATDVELLTATWARADVTQLDETYHCFALRP